MLSIRRRRSLEGSAALTLEKGCLKHLIHPIMFGELGKSERADVSCLIARSLKECANVVLHRLGIWIVSFSLERSTSQRKFVALLTGLTGQNRAGLCELKIGSGQDRISSESLGMGQDMISC